MRTFDTAPPLESDLAFSINRSQSLHLLDLSVIDIPIVDTVYKYSKLECCYPVQSCWGHFDHAYSFWGRGAAVNCLNRGQTMRYRIAYLALCLDDSEHGAFLLELLRQVPQCVGGSVQFGSAKWFRELHNNIYVVQTAPPHCIYLDSCYIDKKEAQYIHKSRCDMWYYLDMIADVAIRMACFASL